MNHFIILNYFFVVVVFYPQSPTLQSDTTHRPPHRILNKYIIALLPCMHYNTRRTRRSTPHDPDNTDNTDVITARPPESPLPRPSRLRYVPTHPPPPSQPHERAAPASPPRRESSPPPPARSRPSQSLDCEARAWRPPPDYTPPTARSSKAPCARAVARGYQIGYMDMFAVINQCLTAKYQPTR